MNDPSLDNIDPARADPPPVSYTTAPPRDRWAHRRTEPRPFALLWILYLLGAAVISFGSSGSILQPTGDMYRYATQLLFILAALGVAIFWPMLRLSQASPASPRRAILMDLFVLLPPLHCVIWPQLFDWLTQWSLPLVSAIAAAFTAWAFLVGAILAIALGADPSHPRNHTPGDLPRSERRSLWMVAFLALAILGPACALSWPGPASFETGLLASPVAFVPALLSHSHDLPQALMHSSALFWSVAAPTCMAIVAWIVAALVSRPGQNPHKATALAIPSQEA